MVNTMLEKKHTNQCWTTEMFHFPQYSRYSCGVNFCSCRVRRREIEYGQPNYSSPTKNSEAFPSHCGLAMDTILKDLLLTLRPGIFDVD